MPFERNKAKSNKHKPKMSVSNVMKNSIHEENQTVLNILDEREKKKKKSGLFKRWD
ncbi:MULTISPECIES: hypothetical protein [unclassified Rummeliibacillus]|uniref:hypothetical protein n=1 Tax=unclassified Rummeliibacillus TaxID=2622809 RepID=UPI0013146F86|nr:MULTISPECIES: hypothetical protein [unclassified Rummeliibacillus]